MLVFFFFFLLSETLSMTPFHEKFKDWIRCSGSIKGPVRSAILGEMWTIAAFLWKLVYYLYSVSPCLVTRAVLPWDNSMVTVFPYTNMIWLTATLSVFDKACYIFASFSLPFSKGDVAGVYLVISGLETRAPRIDHLSITGCIRSFLKVQVGNDWRKIRESSQSWGAGKAGEVSCSRTQRKRRQHHSYEELTQAAPKQRPTLQDAAHRDPFPDKSIQGWSLLSCPASLHFRVTHKRRQLTRNIWQGSPLHYP